MSGIPFFKMTGSGNDFVFFDGRLRGADFWPAEAVQSICDRRTGVGGDGVVLVSPEGLGAARMIYYNADGSRAGMCGNAALCSTRLAARLGMAPAHGMMLHTDSGVLQTRCVGPGWAAELLMPDFGLPRPVSLPLEPGEEWMRFCSNGVPHLIIGVKDILKVDVVGRGRPLRYHPEFPEGDNVNFVGPVADESLDAPWRLRTYERGVEAETLACGTGTVGAAFSLALEGLATLPVRIASWGGNVYSVAGNRASGQAHEPWLCGEGRLVFEGELTP